MDLILDEMITDTLLTTTTFNPHATHLQNRENFVEWMCDLSDKLKVQPETFHNSVNVFDAYMMRKDALKHL
jgi:hypothetical protein